ncbi:oligosaccharide flippase family protein [Emcibacter sp.]|uniref:oligosaccharide flippase family protein n=1 Tax=Emcibacter sp. TaxID=1979954 RepID=UPI002AA8C2B3|nr:oligosaccharide flippase family protein [Emcibacter sp.]
MKLSNAADVTQDNKKDIAKGAGANFGGFLIRLGARIPFLLLVGHLYGAGIFGQFVFAVTYVETLSVLAVFGFKRSIFKFLNGHIRDRNMPEAGTAVLNCLMIVLSFAALIVLATYLGNPLLDSLFGKDMAAAALILAPAILLYSLTEILLASTRAFRMMRYEIFTKSIMEPYSLLIFGTIFYFLGMKGQGLLFAYLFMISLSFSSALYGFFRIFSISHLRGFIPDFGLIRSMLTFSGPTAVYDLGNFFLQRIDVFLLSGLTSSSTVGIYGMALNVATTVKKIRQSFDPILEPVLSQSVESDDLKKTVSEMAQVSYWMASIQVIIVVLLFFYGSALMSLFGSDFAVAGLILSLIILGDAVNGSLGISELLLLYKRPSINPMIIAVMTPFHLGLCYLLIGLLGGEGAALSILITYVVMNILRLVIVRRLFEIFPLDARLLRPLCAGGVAILMLSMGGRVIQLDSLPGVLAGLLVVIPCYFALIFLFSSTVEKQKIRSLLPVGRTVNE